MSFRATKLGGISLTSNWQDIYSETTRFSLHQALLQFSSNNVLVRFVDDGVSRMEFDLAELDQDFLLGEGDTPFPVAFVYSYAKQSRWVWTFPGQGWIASGTGLKIQSRVPDNNTGRTFTRGLVLWSAT